MHLPHRDNALSIFASCPDNCNMPSVKQTESQPALLSIVESFIGNINAIAIENFVRPGKIKPTLT